MEFESESLICTKAFELWVLMYFHNENGSNGTIDKGAHEPKAPGAQASPVALFPWTRNFTPLCLSSPRCINGYRRHSVGG